MACPWGAAQDGACLEVGAEVADPLPLGVQGDVGPSRAFHDGPAFEASLGRQQKAGISHSRIHTVPKTQIGSLYQEDLTHIVQLAYRDHSWTPLFPNSPTAPSTEIPYSDEGRAGVLLRRKLSKSQNVPGCIPPGGKGCGCGGCAPPGAPVEGGPGAPAPGGMGGGGIAGGNPGGKAPGGGTGGGNDPGGGMPIMENHRTP